jgi:hypothetical protein
MEKGRKNSIELFLGIVPGSNRPLLSHFCPKVGQNPVLKTPCLFNNLSPVSQLVPLLGQFSFSVNKFNRSNKLA